MGKWIKRKADEHSCTLPDYDESIRVYDIWECHCRTRWMVMLVNHPDHSVRFVKYDIKLGKI